MAALMQMMPWPMWGATDGIAHHLVVRMGDETSGDLMLAHLGHQPVPGHGHIEHQEIADVRVAV
jgi:hypothetical protein